MKPLLISFFSILSFIALAQNEVEPNNKFSEATVINLSNDKATLFGSIDPAWDIDFYKIKISKPGIISIIISNVATNIDMNLRIYDTNQNQIASTNSSSGVTLNYDYKICTEGEYFIKISDGWSDSNPQLYNLVVKFEAEDIYECNDNFADATPLNFNEIKKGSIRTAWDIDFYKIKISKPGIISITISNVATNIDMNLRIYDTNQNQIASTNSSSGVTLNYDYKICTEGEYFIKISDGWSDSNPQLYNITVNSEAEDVYECNDNFETSTPLLFKEVKKGSIRTSYDVDFYKISVPRAGIVSATISNVPSNIYMILKLYDLDKNEISGTSADYGKTLNFDQKFCEQGEYYIKIYTGNSNSSNQLYSLLVNFDDSDNFECNDNFETATPIALKETKKATIRTAGDVDYYTFSIPIEGVITATISNVASNNPMRLVLYDSDKNEISKANGGYGETINFEYKVCKAGEYFIMIYSGNSNFSSTQFYNFTVDLDNSDTYECNDEFDTAVSISLCQPITPSIRSRYDLDYFKFYVSSAGNVKIQLLEVPTNLYLSLMVFNSARVQVGNTFHANQGDVMSAIINLPSSGNYYALWYDRNNYSNPKKYKFVVDKNCSTSTNDVLTNIFPLRVNITESLINVSCFGSFCNLKILNVAGRVLFQKEINAIQEDIDISFLANGLYFAYLETSEKKVNVQKFIKLN